jgi:hypothetical protein
MACNRYMAYDLFKYAHGYLLVVPLISALEDSFHRTYASQLSVSYNKYLR